MKIRREKRERAEQQHRPAGLPFVFFIWLPRAFFCADVPVYPTPKRSQHAKVVHTARRRCLCHCSVRSRVVNEKETGAKATNICSAEQRQVFRLAFSRVFDVIQPFCEPTDSLRAQAITPREGTNTAHGGWICHCYGFIS